MHAFRSSFFETFRFMSAFDDRLCHCGPHCLLSVLQWRWVWWTFTAVRLIQPYPGGIAGAGEFDPCKGAHIHCAQPVFYRSCRLCVEPSPNADTGGRNWIHEERFDLIADVGTDSEPDVQQWRAMGRELVVRRFRMKAHHEKKLL